MARGLPLRSAPTVKFGEEIRVLRHLPGESRDEALIRAHAMPWAARLVDKRKPPLLSCGHWRFIVRSK
jgi:hypothetical protein